VAAVARHDLDEALLALAHAVRRETEGNPFFIGEVIRHLSESGALFEEDGRWTYRGEIVDSLRVQGFDHPLNWSWISYMWTLSEAVCDLHDPPAATVLYERLRPIAGQVHVLAMMVGCSGSIALWCGMLAVCLGHRDDAERHFADALAMNERLGARPYAVRTQRAWAVMLLDRGAPGDAARAREPIAAGLAEGAALGMAREIVRFERLRERRLGTEA
jgi:hypothetical protein